MILWKSLDLRALMALLAALDRRAGGGAVGPKPLAKPAAPAPKPAGLPRSEVI